MDNIAIFKSGHAEIMPVSKSTLGILGSNYTVITSEQYHNDFDNERAVKTAENFFRKRSSLPEFSLTFFMSGIYSIRYDKVTRKFIVLKEHKEAIFWQTIKKDYGDAREFIINTLVNENKLCLIKRH